MTAQHPDWRIGVFHDFATELAVTQQHTAQAVARALNGHAADVDLSTLSRELLTLSDVASSLGLTALQDHLTSLDWIVERARAADGLNVQLARELFHAGVALDRAARDAAIGLSRSSEVIPPRPVDENTVQGPTALLLEHAGRAALDAAQKLGKQLRIRMAPTHQHLPSALLPVLHRVLLQVVRNAVEHGIEAPAERSHAGKSLAGVLDISLSIRACRVEIAVTDDGRGVDTARTGLTAVPNPRLLFEVLAEPGFTASECGSHRGLGLAGVQHSLERLGGSAEVVSWPGRGSRFRLTFPTEPQGRSRVTRDPWAA